MATFVLVHGAWQSAGTWDLLTVLLRERGHRVITPLLTGLGTGWAPTPRRSPPPSPSLNTSKTLPRPSAIRPLRSFWWAIVMGDDHQRRGRTGGRPDRQPRVCRCISSGGRAMRARSCASRGRRAPTAVSPRLRRLAPARGTGGARFLGPGTRPGARLRASPPVRLLAALFRGAAALASQSQSPAPLPLRLLCGPELSGQRRLSSLRGESARQRLEGFGPR